MKCPKCGYLNQDTFLVCNLCGEALPKVAPDAVGATWSNARFGVSLRRPNAPGWTIVTDAKTLRRKDALAEVVHPADAYVVSVIPCSSAKAPPGAGLFDIARQALEKDESKRDRFVVSRGTIQADRRIALRVQESYLDASIGKSVQEISVFVERAGGVLRLLVAQDGPEFDAHLPQFQAILDSLQLDPAGDPPQSWSHPALQLSLTRPGGADSVAWGWIRDAKALEARGGGWLVEIVNVGAGARVAVRVLDPGSLGAEPHGLGELSALLVDAWRGAAPDLKILAPPVRVDHAGGVTGRMFDVAYKDPQRGALRTRRTVFPCPSGLVEAIAEAPPDRFDAAIPTFDAILSTLRMPPSGKALPLSVPPDVKAWGIALDLPDDARWAVCTSSAMLGREGCVMEMRDLLEPAALIELQVHKRLSGFDVGLTLGAWAERFEKAMKDEAEVGIEAKRPTGVDGQPALSLVRTWKTAATHAPRRDRVVCFERKGALCMARAASTPEDYPRVEEVLRKFLAGVKLAASHHAASVLDTTAEGMERRIVDGTLRIVRRGAGHGAALAPPAPDAGTPAAPPSASPAGASADAVSAGGAWSLDTPIEELEKALRADPGNARAAILLALRFLSTQRYEAAADVLRRAAEGKN